MKEVLNHAEIKKESKWAGNPPALPGFKCGVCLRKHRFVILLSVVIEYYYMEYKKYPKRKFRHLVSAPFIYVMIVPLVILDCFLEVYHRVCFPLYGLPYAKRANYIKIDRHRLKYLSWGDKLNCAYCGYANGLVAYSVKIAGATERYWCGIRHQQKEGFKEPLHHRDFPEYGDERGFKEKYL